MGSKLRIKLKVNGEILKNISEAQLEGTREEEILRSAEDCLEAGGVAAAHNSGSVDVDLAFLNTVI